MFRTLWSRIRRFFVGILTPPPPPPPVFLLAERLLLRDLVEEDIPALHAYLSDPEVLKYEQRIAPFSREEAAAKFRLARAHAAVPDRTFYLLGIVLRGQDTVIGHCLLALNSPVEWGERFQIPMIGYVLHRDYWGCGYATETALTLLRFAFQDLNLPYICAGCAPENAASRRVLEKAGLKLQGTRSEFPGAPLGSDALVYIADSDEWLARFGAKA